MALRCLHEYGGIRRAYVKKRHNFGQESLSASWPVIIVRGCTPAAYSREEVLKRERTCSTSSLVAFCAGT